MIKVLIVMYGLVMFVPDGPPGSDPVGITVLFLDSEAWPHLDEHYSSFNQLGGDAGDLSLASQFDIAVTTPSIGSINLAGLAHVAGLDAGAGTGVHVKRECVELSQDCKIEGRSMTRGRLRLQGTWRTRAVSRCLEWPLPLAFTDQALWEFRNPHDLTKSTGGARRLATALAFETEVEEVEDLVLEMKKDGMWRLVAVEETDKETCGNFLGRDPKTGAPPRCIVIQAANESLVPNTSECYEVDDPPAHCRADRHFAVFYDLLKNPPSEILIPYVVENYYKCRPGGGVGHDPSPRCPPPSVLAYPAEVTP